MHNTRGDFVAALGPVAPRIDRIERKRKRESLLSRSHAEQQSTPSIFTSGVVVFLSALLLLLSVCVRASFTRVIIYAVLSTRKVRGKQRESAVQLVRLLLLQFGYMYTSQAYE